jgi:hypothetical protein
MKEIIVYTLNINGTLGCFPECIAIEIDDKNELSINFVKINHQNIQRYKCLFDSVDEKLVNCCFQLEKETILSKINDRDVRSWDSLLKKYFDGKIKNQDIRYIRDYISDYINQYQNLFFELIGKKKIYLPQGKFPFMWKPLHVELDIPEVFYCFDKKPEGLYYSLDIHCDNRPFRLKDATLISRKTARILQGNKIYEFDGEIEGSKLVPFLTKDFVHISEPSIKEYFQKIVIPLISSNRIITNGFEILTLNELTRAVLRVKEIRTIKQLSFFDVDSKESTPANIVFELLFDYQDFHFWAGQTGVTNRLDMENDSIAITHVERDNEMESVFIDELTKIGLNLDGRVQKRPYLEGMDWLNEHFKQIEMLGVEIQFETKSNYSQKIFVGERNISVEIEECRDWFDIKGKVQFGEYEVPFLQVLYYIKQNKPQILLPNGEYALIPQAWFDEYQSLINFCKFEEGKVTVAKQFCVLTNELERIGKVKLTVKENMRRLIESQLDIHYTLPENFKGRLRYYQQEGYNWLRLLDELGLGGCLADDMGLGKTIQTLCLLQWMKEQDRGTSLLVVPTSLVYNWQQFIPEVIAPKTLIVSENPICLLPAMLFCGGIKISFAT